MACFNNPSSSWRQADALIADKTASLYTSSDTFIIAFLYPLITNCKGYFSQPAIQCIALDLPFTSFTADGAIQSSVCYGGHIFRWHCSQLILLSSRSQTGCSLLKLQLISKPALSASSSHNFILFPLPFPLHSPFSAHFITSNCCRFSPFYCVIPMCLCCHPFNSLISSRRSGNKKTHIPYNYFISSNLIQNFYINYIKLNA